jgi:hypothetical protein
MPTFQERWKLWSANCHNWTLTQIQNTSSAPAGLSNKLILKIDLLLYIRVLLTATPRYGQRSGLVRIKYEIERQCVPHPNVTRAHIWWTLTSNGPDTGSSLGGIDCIRFSVIRDIQDFPLPCHWAGNFIAQKICIWQVPCYGTLWRAILCFENTSGAASEEGRSQILTDYFPSKPPSYLPGP